MNEPRRGLGDVMGSTAGSVFGFAGEQMDATGLQYLRARYYAPEMGRFLTVDPYAGRQAVPYSLHPYQYGYSNPLGYVDPSGLCVNVGGFGALAVSAVSCLGQAANSIASTVGAVATAVSPVGVAANMYMGLESTLDMVAAWQEPFAPSEVVDACAGSSVCASSASGDTLSIAPILEPLGGFTEPTPLEPLEGFELPSLEFDPLGGFTEPFPLEPLGGLPEPPALPPLPPLVATDEEHALICTMSGTDSGGLDLSTVERDLRRLFRRYPVQGGYCNKCAEQVAGRLQKALPEGYNIHIIRLQDVMYSYGALTLRLRDGTLASNLGWHEVVRITTPQGEEFYIDSAVYEQLYKTSEGLQAVSWEIYKSLWEYPDELRKVGQRNP